jgi:hypothetical protein
LDPNEIQYRSAGILVGFQEISENQVLRGDEVKKVSFFLIGAVLGFLVCLTAVYFSGVVLEHFGIRLYASEADQQRNLNVFLIVSAIVSVLSGLLLAKKRA